MTTAQETDALTEQHLGLIFQYTVEAYKTFQKLAEGLPNPMSATMFKQFAVDERKLRDLIEVKVAATGNARVKITLGGDLLFQDILEGSMSFRETTEFLIARERAMDKRLTEFSRNASMIDRFFLTYLIATKRAHVVELERELELLRFDPDWFKREDAEWRIVHGAPNE
jgi:hypothetical protein